jgi:hypothetical protein
MRNPSVLLFKSLILLNANNSELNLYSSLVFPSFFPCLQIPQTNRRMASTPKTFWIWAPYICIIASVRKNLDTPNWVSIRVVESSPMEQSCSHALPDPTQLWTGFTIWVGLPFFDVHEEQDGEQEVVDEADEGHNQGQQEYLTRFHLLFLERSELWRMNR